MKEGATPENRYPGGRLKHGEENGEHAPLIILIRGGTFPGTNVRQEKPKGKKFLSI